MVDKYFTNQISQLVHCCSKYFFLLNDISETFRMALQQGTFNEVRNLIMSISFNLKFREKLISSESREIF